MWHCKGVTLSDALEMTPKERLWFLKRAARQLKAERDARRKG